MEIKKIRQLIRLLKENGLTRLELSEGEEKIVLEACVESRPSSLAVQNAAQIQPQSLPSGLSSGISNESSCQTHDVRKFKEVKSPIVGVFYAAPAPGEPPYVTVGSRVKAGDVLCIIEAMKLMNEITAECDGEIADICVGNGDIVEYGQVLFKIL